MIAAIIKALIPIKATVEAPCHRDLHNDKTDVESECEVKLVTIPSSIKCCKVVVELLNN